MFNEACGAYVIVSNPIAARLQFSTKPNLVPQVTITSFLLSPRSITLDSKVTNTTITYIVVIKSSQLLLSRSIICLGRNEAPKFGEEANFGSDKKEIPGRTTEKIYHQALARRQPGVPAFFLKSPSRIFHLYCS